MTPPKGPAERAAEKFIPWDHPLRLEAEQLAQRYNDFAQTHLANDNKKQLAEMFLKPLAEYASIEQENQHLKEALASARKDLEQLKQCGGGLDKLQQENQRLREAVEKETERLDWIRNHLPTLNSDHTGHVWLAWDGRNRTGHYATLREAIDAAIQQALATDKRG